MNYSDLINMISDNNSALLCGNGFSINFDNRYRCNNLMGSLYDTHCYIIDHIDYNIVSDEYFEKVLYTNFNNAMKEMIKLNTKEKFTDFFENAIIFIHTIIDNPNILKWIKDEKIDQEVGFGLKRSDLLFNIVKDSNTEKAVVNYEYWTIVIYFVLSMQKAPSDLYILDKNNVFIKSVLDGAEYSIKNNTNIDVNAVTNGVYTYFRFLFSSNILLNGDSVSVEKLQKWKHLSINKINYFLSNFDSLMTTNYDKILEK